MKKLVSIILAAAVMTAASALAAGDAGMVNPRSEVIDMAEFTEKTGIEPAVPDGAEDVILRVMVPDEGYVLGEMEFTIGGRPYTVRASSSDEIGCIEDVSGMCCEWESKEDASVGGLNAVIMTASEGGNTIEVVNWLDIVPGIVYSLSTVQPDACGRDPVAVAEQVYIPMQGGA